MKAKGEKITETEIKKLITRAEGADEEELKTIRKDLVGNLEKIEARTLIDTTADMLEGEFQIEGCNDPRPTFKRIFTASLPELEEALARKESKLSPDHPILALLREHVSDVDKLKAIKKRLEVGKEKVIDRLKDYYKAVDMHILKEEQSLFPKLEERGMGEHPDNLREEHEVFKEDLVGVIKLVQSGNNEKYRVAEERFTEDFIPTRANHLFRESFILYPAVKDYIQDEQELEKLGREFGVIDKLGD